MRLWRLKDYLGPKLIDARVSGSGYTPKDTFTSVRINGCIRYIAVWGTPLGVVEGVERLEAELEAHFLRNGEVLEQPRVPVVNAWSPQNAAARSAQESSERLRKRRDVKPLVNGFRQSRLPHEISPVRAEGVIQSVEIGRGDSHGESTLESGDGVDLPAADHEIDRFRQIAAEFLAPSDGQFINETAHQTLVHVEFREAAVAPDVRIVQEALPSRDIVPDPGGGGFVINALGPGIYHREEHGVAAVFDLGVECVIARIPRPVAVDVSAEVWEGLSGSDGTVTGGRRGGAERRIGRRPSLRDVATHQ